MITDLERAVQLFNQIKSEIEYGVYKNAEDFRKFGAIDRLMTFGSRIAAHYRATGELLAEDMEDLQHAMEMYVAQANPDRIHSKLKRNTKGEWEHWYYINNSISTWQWAVQKADGGDLQPLCELLQAEEATEDGRVLIRDLLDRHQPVTAPPSERWSMEYQTRLATDISTNGLRKKRARPTTPIYARSLRDAQLDCAIAEVRALRRVFPRNKKIMETVAALHGPKNEENPPDTPELSEDTLADAIAGRRGSSNRKHQRRKRYKCG